MKKIKEIPKKDLGRISELGVVKKLLRELHGGGVESRKSLEYALEGERYILLGMHETEWLTWPHDKPKPWTKESIYLVHKKEGKTEEVDCVTYGGYEIPEKVFKVALQETEKYAQITYSSDEEVVTDESRPYVLKERVQKYAIRKETSQWEGEDLTERINLWPLRFKS